MKLPRDLGGEELVRHLCRSWNYERVHRSAVMSFCKQKYPVTTGSLSPGTRHCGSGL